MISGCRIISIKAAVLLALAGAALATPAAHAATFTVDRTTDDVGVCPTPTPCSLRQAIESANATAGTDEIAFALPPGSVISLTEGPLEVLPDDTSDALAIRGPGAALLTVRPDPSAPPGPIFSLAPPGRGVTLSGFTIAGGVGVPGSGAAINSGATLLLDRMRISENTADAEGFGAGAGIVAGGATTIRASTFDGNTVTNSGFALSGGAIVNFDTLLVVNSTFTGNDVTGAGPAGGAIWNTEQLTVIGTTISGNAAEAGGGGILSSGAVEISNSILAGNANALAPDCNGALGSQGYNIVGDPTGCTVVGAAGDQVGTAAAPLNPLLGPLGDNGGPTPTMALLAGSPARDAGNPAAPSDSVPALPPELVPCPTTDQRGFARPGGARCDIGAFEVIPPPVPPIPPPGPPPPPPVAPLPPPPPFVAPPVDTFKCYEGDDARFEPRSVRVRDQFSTANRTASLRKATLVCNPARNNGSALRAPAAHLVCYQSRDVASFTPRFVNITNQLGTRPLRVVKPVSLCVPSLKRKGGRAPGTTPDPQRRLDHFRCYEVDPKVTRGTVRTADQFVTTRTNIVSVVRLCNPVAKNGGTVRRPTAHLVCYSIRDIVASKVRAVTVRNQFGVARLSVGKARSLCLPSLKRDLIARSARTWPSLR